MPRFEFMGGHPHPDGNGGAVRPGDILTELPDFGPFRELPDDDAEPAEDPPADPPGPPAQPPASTAPSRPRAARPPRAAAEGK